MPTSQVSRPIPISSPVGVTSATSTTGLRKFGTAVFGLLLLGIFATAAVVSIWKVLTLSTPTAGPVMVATLTAVGSITGLIVSKHWERRNDVEQAHRAKKEPIYDRFMEFWFKLIFANRLGEPPVTELEMMQFVGQFTQQLIIWGSDDVLKAYATLRRQNMASGDSKDLDSTQMLVALEDVLLAIRKDMGHKNKGIGQGDLLVLFITDNGEHLSKPKRAA